MQCAELLPRSCRGENLEPALLQGIASIPLCEVCDLGTLVFITRFEGYLLPEDARVYTKPPRVMADESSWGEICTGLISKGVCVLLPHSKVFRVKNQLLLNGLLASVKTNLLDLGKPSG